MPFPHRRPHKSLWASRLGLHRLICPFTYNPSAPGRRFHLDSRLGGLGRRLRRLLLGPRHMGAGSRGRFPVDSGILGLGRQWIRLV